MKKNITLQLQQKIYGSIMGTALGDSIGLPFEGVIFVSCFVVVLLLLLLLPIIIFLYN